MNPVSYFIRRLLRLSNAAQCREYLGVSDTPPGLQAHIDNNNNPHQVTAGQVGLGATDAPTFAALTVLGTLTLGSGAIIEDDEVGGGGIAVGYINSSGHINCMDGFQINNVQVVGGQLLGISEPVGGATIDANARTAINDIINRLETHGLIAGPP